ncbi:protein FAM214B [Anguilla anguilla]|uniref:protein FAM214B n=1 Tax=Anguilla anguilla TaxID=7936 RepID=UPI0015AD77A9|nr:protein FAM214B [Anguilla anguilla]XP_035247432.1 protein FAM214B [Anguilla anguilla]XP_035247433.1 protein FAM214B [Anguilla anguilla]XP_035247434.1 protein FAM214B [Anguilla anguilla]XP_035247435.1 protein FAM214B [Anguilla anguilla]
MRHIHVEIARKEAPVELPDHGGDLPPPSAQTGARPGLLRPYGQEEIRLQKVYQLSIFSQLGGLTETLGGQRLARPGLKRALEDWSSGAKRPHLGGDPRQAPPEVPVEGGSEQIFSDSGPRAVGHGGGMPDQDPSCQVAAVPLPLARHPSQHNRPIPGPEAPLSPKPQPQDSTPVWNPTPSATLPRTEPLSANGASDCTPAKRARDHFTNGGGPDPQAIEPTLCDLEASGDTDWPVQERGGETARSSKSSPPEAGHPQTTSTNGLASPEKTPAVSRDVTSGPSSGPCPAKRRLLSSSDAGESCSEDEGPSTSKRSRLALLAPGLGLGACRSTDAKGAPFWNHLLPSARERPKSAADCSRVGRRLKSGLRLKSRQLRSGRRSETFCSASISRSLLGNFEESMLKGRFPPSGRIDGFTAEIGASGSYCPQHATLPVQVSYYDISEHSAPSPFLGVICLEPLGKKGYSVPKAGTIQVTLFNPNKTVVKMFLVTYNFEDMPVNHVTFLRHRIFLVPVGEVEGERQGEGPEDRATDRKKILCYLIHLRFQSSKSGKIYLHNDIRLLFSRKSIEVDTGIPYELKSYTEVPRNPKYSPRV